LFAFLFVAGKHIPFDGATAVGTETSKTSFTSIVETKSVSVLQLVTIL
jgi:hypothetical protein